MGIEINKNKRRCAECGIEPFAYIVVGGKFFCSVCVHSASSSFLQWAKEAHESGKFPASKFEPKAPVWERTATGKLR
jgi:hypothetical protein